jgi:hypothetical protein
MISLIEVPVGGEGSDLYSKDFLVENIMLFILF